MTTVDAMTAVELTAVAMKGQLALKGQLAQDAEVLAAGITEVLHRPEYQRVLRAWEVPGGLQVIDSVDPAVNPLPSPPHLEGPVPPGLYWAVAKVAASIGYPIELTIAPGGNPTYSGVAKYSEHLIQVNSTRSHLHRVKTACHESAHALLHRPGTPIHAQDLSRRVHELQAETAAWLLLRRLGVDSGSFSFPYIAKYGAVRMGAVLLVDSAAERAVATVAGPVRWLAAGVTSQFCPRSGAGSTRHDAGR
jgi:hypothetical protein